MNDLLHRMSSAHEADTVDSKKNAIKETLQVLTLYGLSKSGFFKEAAFYGGTALRIFHGLDRFSEDLDFSLLKADPDFNLYSFIPSLEKTLLSFGLNISVKERKKSVDTNIQSAFLKGNTRELIMDFYDEGELLKNVMRDEILKVKFEVDIDPPDFAGFDRKFALNPYPHDILMYDMPSLFAGKIHAILCRKWKNRTKGRDLYDYLFYIKNDTPVNMDHLRCRMIQTGYIDKDEDLNIESLKDMLRERFEKIDFDEAIADVEQFVADKKMLDMWCSELFVQVTDNIKKA